MKPKNVVFTTIAIIFGTLVLLSSGTKEAEFDWPQWRGPNGDGISMETDWDPKALIPGAKILWITDVGRGYSNVAIKGDLLFTMGVKDRSAHVLCLNAVTGEEIWRYSCETDISYEPQSTPTIDGNRVYGLGSDGTLLCLKSKNGKLVWRKHLKRDFGTQQPGYGFATSPVIDGELLLLNANSKLVGLNKNTGDLLWGIEDEVPGSSWGSYSTMVVSELDGIRCALFVGPSTFRAVEMKSGNELWAYEHGEVDPIADPIVLGNEVFLSFPTRCIMLDMTETEVRELWNSTELNVFLSNAVLVDGYLYGTHWPVEEVFVSSRNWSKMLRLDEPFRCISWETGAVMWEENMKYVSLTAAGGMLILLGVDGMLRIVEATPLGFKECSSADVLGGEKKMRIFATPPVLCSGQIYCRNHTGDLISIDVSK